MLCFTGSKAQNPYVDSLIHFLNTHSEQDTLRVMTTHRLSYRLSEIDPSKAWNYATETEQLARKLKFEKGECLSNINYAILESNEGNFQNSADYYIKAIQIAERIQYTRGLSISYNNIGDNYLKMKKYDKVLEYSQKALDLNRSIDEKRGQAINLEQIGQVYYLKDDLEDAMKYWEQGFALARESKDPNIYTQIMINQGKYFIAKNQVYKGLGILRVADSIARSTSELYLQILGGKSMVLAYEKLHNEDSVILILKHILNLAQNLENRTEQSEIARMIADFYAQHQQYKEAFTYLQKHKILSDSVLNEKNFAHVAYVQTKYETQLKDKENIELRAIQKLQKKELNQKNWLLLASVLGLLLAAVSFILLVRSFTHKRRTLELQEARKQSEYLQQLAELEVKSLRSQMNPHFLFNSLNSIRNYIIKNEPQKASNYLASFANLMRRILDASQQSFIALEEEIEMLKLYLNLELMRFSSQFTYHIALDQNLEGLNLQIPSMVLQPFIENAIWHGLLPEESEGAHLEIAFLEIPENHQQILCTITDNGIGREKSLSQNTGIKRHKSKGIDITRSRLKRLFEFEATDPIRIEDLKDDQGNASGTRVLILLPVK